MTSKRYSLSFHDRLILKQALDVLIDKSSIDHSFAADLGRTRIEKLRGKIVGAKNS